jgi:hypothetical protein
VSACMLGGIVLGMTGPAVAPGEGDGGEPAGCGRPIV